VKYRVTGRNNVLFRHGKRMKLSIEGPHTKRKEKVYLPAG
jgi:hypothetical protein